MGARYSIDSNAVIDFLKGVLPVEGMKMMRQALDDGSSVSVITQIEVLGYPGSREEVSVLQRFFGAITESNCRMPSLLPPRYISM